MKYVAILVDSEDPHRYLTQHWELRNFFFPKTIRDELDELLKKAVLRGTLEHFSVKRQAVILKYTAQIDPDLWAHCSQKVAESLGSGEYYQKIVYSGQDESHAGISRVYLDVDGLWQTEPVTTPQPAPHR